MLSSYSPYQVYDSLIRQGVDEEKARAIVQAMNYERKTPQQLGRAYKAIGVDARLPIGSEGKQGSSFAPNLGEGIGALTGAALLGPKGKLAENADWFAKLGRRARTFGAVGLGATIGNLLGEKASGTNFYDTATTPQLVGDISGSYLGGMYGDKLGSSLDKKLLPKILESKVGKKVAGAVGKKVGTTLLGRLAGGAAGRLAGAGLGGFLGPLGALAGATLGGWLLSSAMPKGSKSVEEDKDYYDYENPL